MRNKAVIGQATINLISQVWKSLEDSLPEFYCISVVEACVRRESASSMIYVRKKGMICNCPIEALTRNLPHRAEMGKKTGIESTNRSRQASCFERRA